MASTMATSILRRRRADASTGVAGCASGLSSSGPGARVEVKPVQADPSHQRSGAVPHGSRYQAGGGKLPGRPGPAASTTFGERSGR